MTAHPSPLPSLLSEARALLPEIVALRRTLHRRPEVGLQLPFTQSVAVAELERLGLRPRLGRSVSSVTAVVAGAHPGPTILLRGDMDGLPLHEDTGLEFASETGDTMHACGHDTHVAMLLGAARLLVARREQFAGNVLLMFQPGEEGWHGARYMLDEGLLEAAPSPVAAAFAIHISTRYASGTIHLRAGAIYAAADTIRLTVRGRGGHASTPHLALDPVPVAAEIVLALQSMVTRTVDVFDPAVVTIAHVMAGTKDNIIPETALVEGTMRTVSEATRAAVQAGVRRVVDGICAAHGASAELEIEPGYGVTVNDADFAALVRNVATDLLGADSVHALDAPVMGAEDFSYVLQRVPGAMCHLGARPPEVDEATAPQNHSNRVVFDEPAMAVGAALHAAVALRYLGSA
jgi:amidohydrolase